MASSKSSGDLWLWVHLIGAESGPLQANSVCGLTAFSCKAINALIILNVDPGG